MTASVPDWPPDDPVVQARATLTTQMLHNLIVVFAAAADDGPIIVEIGKTGIWAVTPDGKRIFVGGEAVPPPGDA